MTSYAAEEPDVLLEAENGAENSIMQDDDLALPAIDDSHEAIDMPKVSIDDSANGAEETPATQAQDANEIAAQPQTNQNINNIPAAAQASEETPELSVYIPFDGVNSDTLHIDFKSFFFSQEQEDMLYSKVNSFKRSGGVINDVVNNLGAVGEGGIPDSSNAPKPIEHKFFYLGSILYPSDKHWTLWLNEKKIRKEDESAEVTVDEVTENYAVFLYKTMQLAQESPGYLAKLTKQDDTEWDYASPDGNIEVSSLRGVVRFRLKQNQSFSLFDMIIGEGQNKDIGVSAESLGKAVDQTSKDLNMLTPVNVNDPVIQDSPIKDRQQEDMNLLDPNNTNGGATNNPVNGNGVSGTPVQANNATAIPAQAPAANVPAAKTGN